MSAVSINNALQALTNSNLGITTYGPAIQPGTPAGSGQYSLCTTTAVLNFLTSIGSGVQVTIPAPVSGMFLADGFTVDQTNPLVAALIAAVIGFLSDPSNNLVVSYRTGVKSSRRTEFVG